MDPRSTIRSGRHQGAAAVAPQPRGWIRCPTRPDLRDRPAHQPHPV